MASGKADAARDASTSAGSACRPGVSGSRSRMKTSSRRVLDPSRRIMWPPGYGSVSRPPGSTFMFESGMFRAIPGGAGSSKRNTIAYVLSGSRNTSSSPVRSQRR